VRRMVDEQNDLLGQLSKRMADGVDPLLMANTSDHRLLADLFGDLDGASRDRP
jgi:hypothetical protein